MAKKILYIILVIVIIVVLAMIWRKPKSEAPTNVSNNNSAPVTNTVETKANIGNELSNMNIDTGINNDLNSVDKDIKSL